MMTWIAVAIIGSVIVYVLIELKDWIDRQDNQ